MAFCCSSAFAADPVLEYTAEDLERMSSELAADPKREFRIAHIMAADEKSAKDIIQKLRNGADFGQLARENSGDVTTAENGGDLGWWKAEELNGIVEKLGQVVEQMEDGEHSKTPIRIDSSWHVLFRRTSRTGVETFEPPYKPADLRRALLQSEANRKAIQALRAKGLPPFVNLPPVSDAKATAPAGADFYSGAYQTSSKCIFFYEKSDKTFATHADWKGPACKGKPLNGKGTLRMTVSVTGDTGNKTLMQHEMRGTFVNGLLNGMGEKTNLGYTLEKTSIDAYYFSGQFEHGLLSGPGKRTWIGAESERPNAVQWTGDFVAGIASGMIRQVRSQPYEGILGDVISLSVSKNGEAYIQQAQAQRGRLVEGAMYTEDEEWTLFLESWKYGAPVSAVFVRAPDYKNAASEKDGLFALCGDWKFESGAWQCKQGSVRRSPAGASLLLAVQKTPFSLKMQSGADGLTVASNPPVYLLQTEMDENRTVRCNPDLSECAGQAEVSMAWPLRWRGDVKYRRGEVTPVGAGTVLALRGEDIITSKFEVVAECDRLASPTECASGLYEFSNGGSFKGPFRLANMRYGRRSDSSIPGYEAEGEKQVKIELHGWGRTTFSNGKWADVLQRDDEIVDVGDCDDPNSGESVTCTLSGQTVMFNYPRRVEYREERQPVQTWEPIRMPDFNPIPIPQRQPYILPGMR